ncbi:MAG: hypothetical protein L3J04_08520 [Robiginitomaculum sp.]|nr:hypothetical protein [Robiginitomaculum sp.]
MRNNIAPIAEYQGIDSVAEIAAFIAEHGELGGKLLAHFHSLETARDTLEDHYAVLVKAVKTKMAQSEGTDVQSIDDSWLCLRRVGTQDADVYSGDKNKVWVRTLSPSGKGVIEEEVPLDAIVGKVFHRFEALKHTRIKVASRLPFEPEPGASS